MPSFSPVVAASVAVVVAGVVKASFIGSRDSDLPPGPPTRPLVGNLPDYPTDAPHLVFSEWAKKYGPVFSLKMANGTIVVLNTPQAVRYILDTKNTLTADRPDFHVLNEVTTGLHLGFIKYGPTWRVLRRAATEILNAKACARHLPIQHAESAQFMYDLLDTPEDFFTHCHRYSSSVVVSVVFGQRVPRVSSRIPTTMARNGGHLDELVRPGNTPPIDLIPLFKYVPERWAKWKTLCRDLREDQRQFYSDLVGACETRMKNGQGNGCFVETLVERQEELAMTRDMIMYLGESLIEPGADSTKTFLQNAFLLLLTHPEVQKKAREEADRVIGTDRSPTLDDIKDLPYARAVVEEVNRLRPFGPLGLPHSSSDEVFYDGYRIPKNSTIFINVWAIYHDENLFDEPNKFKPERYLDSPLGVKEGVDPKEVANLKDLVFGAGRRICPGIILGRNSLVLNTARILWGFDIKNAKNEDGTLITPDFMDCKPTSSNAPSPFKCDIQPRSPHHADTIRREFLAATSTLALFEQELDESDKAFMRDAKLAAEKALSS